MVPAYIPLRRALIALVVSVLLVACDSATPTPTATRYPVAVTIVALPTPTRVEPTQTATPRPTATPQPPRIVTIAMSEDIQTLHPFYATSSAAQAVLGAIYVGCVGQNERNEPVALGCEQVPTLENGGARLVGEGLDRYLEVTFKIRAGWRWTDGMPVTAQDALFAWQTIMSPESNLRDPLTQKVYTMSAPDPRTIVVSFMSAAQARAAAGALLTGDMPFEYFSQLGDYAQYAQQESAVADAQYWAVLRWLPVHVLKDVLIKDQSTSPFATQPLGDGAYELVKVIPNSVVLKRAAAPFPLGEAAFEGIEFASLSAFQLRQTRQNILSVMAAEEGSTLQAPQDDRIDFDGATVEQVLLNVDREPFDDVKVRQALAHAIDQKQLVSEVLTLAPVSPISTTLDYDPAKSAALLTEAGWDCSSKPCRKTTTNARGVPISQTLEFTLVTSERVPRNIVAQNIQRQLAEVGFAVNVQIVFGLGAQSKLFAPYAEGGILLTRNFAAALYRAPYQANQSWRGAFDCASIPNERQNDASRGNASGYCDADFDQQIAQTESGEVVLSAGARAAALAEAKRKLEGDAPVVRLYVPRQSAQVRGIAGVKPAANLPITWNVWEWMAK